VFVRKKKRFMNAYPVKSILLPKNETDDAFSKNRHFPIPGNVFESKNSVSNLSTTTYRVFLELAISST